MDFYGNELMGFLVHCTQVAKVASLNIDVEFEIPDTCRYSAISVEIDPDRNALLWIKFIDDYYLRTLLLFSQRRITQVFCVKEEVGGFPFYISPILCLAAVG